MKKQQHNKRRGEKQKRYLWEAERLLRRRCLVLRRSLAILVSSATVCVHHHPLHVSHTPVDTNTNKLYTHLRIENGRKEKRREEKRREEKSKPFGVNLMRSQDYTGLPRQSFDSQPACLVN